MKRRGYSRLGRVDWAMVDMVDVAGMGDCALMAVAGVASETLAVQVELPILPICAEGDWGGGAKT